MSDDAAPAAEVVVTEATALAASPFITKECLVGGPVTAVQFLSPSTCLYSVGPYLHRVDLDADADCDRPYLETQTENGAGGAASAIATGNRLLVFIDGGSIHGIRSYRGNDQDDNQSVDDTVPTTMIIFGGRKICFVSLTSCSCGPNGDANREMKVLDIVQAKPNDLPLGDDSNTTRTSTNNTPSLEVDDWIWDCRVWSSSRRCRLNEHRGSSTTQRLLVGLAHNRVAIYTIGRVSDDDNTRTTTIRLEAQHFIQQGMTRCLSYCMDLWCDAAAGVLVPMIAVGTVTNTIHIWSVPVEDETATASNDTIMNGETISNQEEHVLVGHQGVIHAVKFHRNGQRLASTSDDRTVRLWGRQLQGQHDGDTHHTCWTLLWTAFGHTARGWDVAFALLPIGGLATNATVENDNDVDDDDADFVVVSAGEDGSMRMWSSTRGEELAVARGHGCQCVWRVDTIAVATVASPPIAMPSETVGPSESAAMLDAGTFCDNVGCWAVTGGNDGTVAFYNVLDRLPTEIVSTPEYKLDSGAQSPLPTQRKDGTWQFSLTVPDDRIVPSPSEDALPLEAGEPVQPSHEPITRQGSDDMNEAVHALPKTKKAKKPQQQTIVGMKFSSLMSTLLATVGPALVVATRTGSVWCLDTATQEWIALDSWLPPAHGADATTMSDADTATTAGGCCMCLHSTHPIMAVGTMSGDVILSRICRRIQDAGLEQRESPVVLSSQPHRSVQKLEWVQPHVLLSFHVQSILWHSFPALYSTPDSRLSWHEQVSEYSTEVLVTGVKGLVICSAFREATSLLVVGDTRGNVVLFNVSTLANDGKSEISPTSVVRTVHQKEHVTALQWASDKSIVSVGNDGHIAELAVDDSGRLVKLLSVPVGAFTGLSYIWRMPRNVHSLSFTTIVGGYYGNRFAVVDVSNGYEFFSLDTGGRQRTIDLFTEKGSSISPVPSIAAVCQTRRDGRNDILLSGHGPTAGSSVESQALIRYSTGVAFHGESVFDVNLFPLDRQGRLIALLTASEDCSAKIALFQDGVLKATKGLPPQVSGIRAVCSCPLDEHSTLVVIGEKAGVKLFLVPHLDPLSTLDNFHVHSLGVGTLPEKPSIDHRLNCVGCVTLSKASTAANEDDTSDYDLGAILVVSGDSNGSCYLYRFSKQDGRYDLSNVQLLYRDDRPILSLDLVHVEHVYLLVFGDTGGSVGIFELPDSSESSAWANLPHRPLLRYKAHSMGTNAIAASVIPAAAATAAARTLSPVDDTIGSHARLRVCSGGDDQAICCCDIAVAINESHALSGAVRASILQTRRTKEAALSAIKGIAFADVNAQDVVASGYDQRIALWQCGDGEELAFQTDKALDIGDINSLATFRSPNHRDVLAAVGGAGIELLSIHLPTREKE